MRISLKRLNQGMHFEATNEDGSTVQIDGAKDSDLGEGMGMRPMQLVLTAVAACSVFDIIHILKKQRQDVKDIQITADGDRPDTTPAPFNKVHLHFDIFGNVDESKAARAVELAVEKYCSVGEMVKSTAEITYSFEVKR